MTTLNGLPPYWESFIQTISGQTKLPKFDKLWEDFTQEETKIETRKILHGPQVEDHGLVLKETPSSLIPRKVRENEGIFTNISTNLGDKFLLQI